MPPDTRQQGQSRGQGRVRDAFLHELQVQEAAERAILDRLGVPADLHLGYPSKPEAVTAALTRIPNRRAGQQAIDALLTLKNIEEARHFIAAGDSWAAAAAMQNVGVFGGSRLLVAREAAEGHSRGAHGKAAKQRAQHAEWQAIVAAMPKHTTKTHAALHVTHQLAARRKTNPSIVLPSINTVRSRIQLDPKKLTNR